jgi:hypothetical protein
MSTGMKEVCNYSEIDSEVPKGYRQIQVFVTEHNQLRIVVDEEDITLDIEDWHRLAKEYWK